MLDSIDDKSNIKDKLARLKDIRSTLVEKHKHHSGMVTFFENNDDCPTCEQHINEVFKEEMLSTKTTTAKELQTGLYKLQDELNSTNSRFTEITDITKTIRSNEVKIATLGSSVDEIEKFNVKLDTEINIMSASDVSDNDLEKLEGLKEWACSLSDWQVLALMGVGLRRGGIASGQKVFDKLASEFCVEHYEDMLKPFASVATDLYTGREVVFNSGPIADTIQASCAIPALFAPVAHGDRWLVDGAVVNPVPVNLCRQLGADFVIAVNLNADFRPLRLEKLRQDHEENQRKTEDFFTKSQNVLRQWFSPDNKQDDGKQEDKKLEDKEIQKEQ